jgi:hypothetical protein
MARTQYRVNPGMKVPLCTVSQTLSIHRKDVDLKSIKDKVISLLKMNNLDRTGSLPNKLKRLIRHYESHPETLPTWTDLALYHIQPDEDPIRPIMFVLDDRDELIEV